MSAAADIIEREDESDDSLRRSFLNMFTPKIFRRAVAPRVSFRSSQTNTRPAVHNGKYSPVYDTPRSSDFNTRASRMPVFTSFALQQYFAVMRDNFLYEIEIENEGASTPYGRQLPWREREGIARPPAVAYGNMVVLQPDDPYLTLRRGNYARST